MLPVQIHLSETEEEVDDCVAEHGVRPAALPRPGRAARPADAARARRLARRRRARADRRARRHRRHQPGRQHEARGRRRLPVPGRARARASRSGSAPTARAPTTRSTCSPTPRSSPCSRRTPPATPPRSPPRRRWRSRPGGARRCSAAAALEAGAPADFLLVRTDAPELSLGDLDAGLVYAASGAVVDTTVVAGRVLMRGGVVEGADEVRQHAVECAAATRPRRLEPRLSRDRVSHQTEDLWEFFARWLPRPPARVLDVGCGDGASTRRLAGYGIRSDRPRSRGAARSMASGARGSRSLETSSPIRGRARDPIAASPRRRRGARSSGSPAPLCRRARLVVFEFAVDAVDDAARDWLVGQRSAAADRGRAGSQR